MGSLYNILNKMIDKTPVFDLSHAYSVGSAYSKVISSFPAGYHSTSIDIGEAPANKYPLVVGFDITGVGTSNIYVLGFRPYKDTDGHWKFFLKMTNTSSALTNTTLTVYISWVSV